MWLVAIAVPIGDYTAFAVFWSSLFLIVGAMGGLQQEVARAGFDRRASALVPARSRPVVVGLGAAAALAVVLAVSSPLWAPRVFASESVALVVALVGGACAYTLVATLAGSLYGIAAWVPLAAMIALDGIARLLFVGIALVVAPEPVALAWAVVLPFPLAVLVVVPWVAARARERLALDVGYGRLSANAARTIVAALATALIVSGFPALLRATTPDAPDAVVGPLILVLTLTRAPLVVPMLAMQSYLIVHFQRDTARLVRRALVLSAVVLVVAGLLAVLLAAIGPQLFGALFGAEFALGGLTIGGLVLSSGLIAALCVTGPALLARAQHSIFTAGWIASAAGLVLALLVPGEVAVRTIVALSAGPLIGLALHVGGLLARPATGIRTGRSTAPTT